MSFETRFEELKVEDFIAVDSHLDKGLKIDINTENLPGLARFTPSTPCNVHRAEERVPSRAATKDVHRNKSK